MPENYIETTVDNNSIMASNHCIQIANKSFRLGIDERTNYIIIYAILMAVAIYAYVHRTFAFFLICLRASTMLHDKLFRGITRAKMNFYTNNPSGRILNRFSRDVNNIDTLLPPSLFECISVSYI